VSDELNRVRRGVDRGRAGHLAIDVGRDAQSSVEILRSLSSDIPGTPAIEAGMRLEASAAVPVGVGGGAGGVGRGVGGSACVGGVGSHRVRSSSSRDQALLVE
jgi:hypothetical protein